MRKYRFYIQIQIQILKQDKSDLKIVNIPGRMSKLDFMPLERVKQKKRTNYPKEENWLHWLKETVKRTKDHK